MMYKLEMYVIVYKLLIKYVVFHIECNIILCIENESLWLLNHSYMNRILHTT